MNSGDKRNSLVNLVHDTPDGDEGDDDVVGDDDGDGDVGVERRIKEGGKGERKKLNKVRKH